MFFVVLVCLSVFLCLFVSKFTQSYERIARKLYEGVWGDTMKNRLNFGGDLGLLR